MLNDKLDLRRLIENRDYATLNKTLKEGKGSLLSKTEKYDLLRFSLSDKKALKMLLNNDINILSYPSPDIKVDSIFKAAITQKKWKVAIYLIENYPKEFKKACELDRSSKDGYRRSNTALMLINLDLKSELQKKLFALCIKNEDINHKDSLGLPLMHSLMYSDLQRNDTETKYDQLINKITYVLNKVNYDVHIKNNSGDCMLGFAAYKMMLSETDAESHYLIKNLKIYFVKNERDKIRKMMNEERTNMKIEHMENNSNKVRL